MSRISYKVRCNAPTGSAASTTCKQRRCAEETPPAERLPRCGASEVPGVGHQRCQVPVRRAHASTELRITLRRQSFGTSLLSMEPEIFLVCSHSDEAVHS